MLIAESELEQLATRHHTVVLMKGVEAAQLYHAPVQRPFRDLDILVPDAQDLWQDYRERGYRPSPRRRIDIDHHHLPTR